MVFTLIKKYWIAHTLFILTIITILSLIPLDELPPFPSNDKTQHFIAYAVLMLPTAIRKPQYIKEIVLFFICWSGAVELLQPYVNRYGEWQDLLANIIGLIFGWLLAKSIDKLCL
ncbi:MAG: VanZ family protein [Pleurocapsa sp.]